MATLKSLNPMGKGVAFGGGLLKIIGDRIPQWGEGVVALVGVMAHVILKTL